MSNPYTCTHCGMENAPDRELCQRCLFPRGGKGMRAPTPAELLGAQHARRFLIDGNTADPAVVMQGVETFVAISILTLALKTGQLDIKGFTGELMARLGDNVFLRMCEAEAVMGYKALHGEDDSHD